MFIVVSFILPLVLFLVSSLLKGVLLSIRVALHAQLEIIKHIRDAKQTDKEVSALKRNVVRAVYALINALRALILLLRTVASTLAWLGIKMASIVLIVTILVMNVLSYTVVVSDIEIPNRSTESSGSSGSYTHLDYFSIDWFYDFTEELSSLSGHNKHWAEFTILNMRTILGEGGDGQLVHLSTMPFYFIGFKNVESGTSFFKNTSGKSIFTHYSDIDPTSKYGGPLQMSRGGGWSQFNPAYTPVNSLPSGGEPRNASYGSRQFTPDIVLGALRKNYEEFMMRGLGEKSGTIRGYGERSRNQIIALFEELGVQVTDERLEQVFLMFFANAYNHGNIEDFNKRISYKGLAAMYIGFLDTYLWSRNVDGVVDQLMVDLTMSINSKSGTNPDNIYPKRSYNWAWGKRNGNNPPNYSYENDNQDWGVLDRDGNPVNKSLYGYILSTFDESTRQKVLSWLTGAGVNINNAKQANRDQFTYGFTSYMDGLYALEKTLEVIAVDRPSTGEMQLGDPFPDSARLSSRFGMRTMNGVTRLHKGIDLSGSLGKPILAAEAGVVRKAINNNGGYGNYILIDHTPMGIPLSTAYAHLHKIEVGVGETVAKGQRIGVCGSTGRSTGPHLHFEVIDMEYPDQSSDRRFLDPIRFLSKYLMANPHLDPNLPGYNPFGD